MKALGKPEAASSGPLQGWVSRCGVKQRSRRYLSGACVSRSKSLDAILALGSRGGGLFGEGAVCAEAGEDVQTGGAAARTRWGQNGQIWAVSWTHGGHGLMPRRWADRAGRGQRARVWLRHMGDETFQVEISGRCRPALLPRQELGASWSEQGPPSQGAHPPRSPPALPRRCQRKE